VREKAAMTEQELLQAEPIAVPTDSKWLAGISPDQPVCEVAGRVLAARLKAVCHALPLAAEKSDEDVEYVHQLRISVRRAVEAVRIFSGLIEQTDVDGLRDRLRQIRIAADDARNWDVMAERFSHGGDIPAKFLEQIKARRREVQGPIVSVCQEIMADACETRIGQLVQEVESHRHGDGRRRFGQEAPRCLASVVKKFFKAATFHVASDESLHSLRIRTKKLRYTMEIVAVAFDSDFRKKLYPQVTLFQDLLGTVNDHATAKTWFGDWLSKSGDAAEQAFLEGLLLSEQRATEDLRAAFLATWTSKVVSGLKRQFRPYRV
jgi:CHAD domain-containing protein